MIHHISGDTVTLTVYRVFLYFGESGLLENEPTAPAEQAHTTQRQ